MFLLCGFLDRFFAFKYIRRTILKSLVFCVIASLHQETSFLRARVQQVQVPLGDAARPSHLLTSQLPLMWQLYPEERYMDNNSRLWQIQHHLMVGLLLNHVFFFSLSWASYYRVLYKLFFFWQVRGVQELLLKLLPDD